MQTRQHASISEWAKSVGSKATTHKGQIAAIRAAIAKTGSVFAPNPYQGRRKVTRAEWEKQSHDKRLAVHVERAREMAGVGVARLQSLGVELAKSWPLRKAESRWAGGEHYVRVHLSDTPGCRCEMEREWSKNGKWSGNNSFAYLAVTARALVLFPTLRTPDGGIVLDAQKVGHREYRMTWVDQGRGTAIKPCAGWWIRGYHSSKPTLEQARREAEKARHKAAGVRKEERARKRVEEACRAASMASMRRIWVGVEDSLRAGNCEPITKQVAARVWGKIDAVGPCAVRADVLLGVRDDAYARRAVVAASMR